MRVRSVLVVSATLLTSVTIASLISAQENPPLKPGTRMRAWMIQPDTNVWVGGLLLIDQRYLELRTDTVIRLRLRDIERLEKSLGKSEWLTVGLPMLGASIGAISAPALMQESLACETGAGSSRECGSEAPKPLIGAAVGVIAAMILGNLIATERWVELDIGEYQGTVGGRLSVVPIAHPSAPLDPFRPRGLATGHRR